MKAVFDTSPLVFLSKLGYLHLLKTIYQNVLVPEAVFTELGVKKDTVYHDVETLIGKSFIEIEERPEELFRQLALHRFRMKKEVFLRIIE